MSDDSRNKPVLALGDGWHNNHHRHTVWAFVALAVARWSQRP